MTEKLLTWTLNLNTQKKSEAKGHFPQPHLDGPGSTRPETNSAPESTLPRVNSAGSTRPGHSLLQIRIQYVYLIWYLEDRYYQSTLEIIRAVAGGDKCKVQYDIVSQICHLTAVRTYQH